MKLILSFLFVALVAAPSFAQTKEQELSNAEKFSARGGTLLEKVFITIGDIKGAKIEVVHYTDLISGQKQSALKFEHESSNGYSLSTKSAVLDVDEIDALIKSLKLIQEKIFPSTATNYTEVSFKSRGGFEAGCFWDKDSWSTYLKLEKYDKDSYVFLKKDDFPELLTLLEQAKTNL